MWRSKLVVKLRDVKAIFAFIFLERIMITSFKDALKVCEHTFFQEIKMKSSGYL